MQATIGGSSPGEGRPATELLRPVEPLVILNATGSGSLFYFKDQFNKISSQCNNPRGLVGLVTPFCHPLQLPNLRSLVRSPLFVNFFFFAKFEFFSLFSELAMPDQYLYHFRIFFPIFQTPLHANCLQISFFFSQNLNFFRFFQNWR